MFTCDIQKTQQRKAELEKYFNENVLSEKGEFICRHYEECKRLRSGQFYAGQLHHVGDYYDLAKDGKPLRIAVIGMSYGDSRANVTMAYRQYKMDSRRC